MLPPLNLAAASSLMLHKRLARAQLPRPSGLSREEIEGLAETRQAAVRRTPGWIARMIETVGGEVHKRLVTLSAPDAPLLVADNPFRFAVFLPVWPDRRPDPGFGQDWTLALALGHLTLHWATLEVPAAEDADDDAPLLYVPHFIARTAGSFPARLEAMWYAAALLMPRDDFRAAWAENAGDAAAIGQALAAGLHPELAAARADALGLARAS